MSSQELRVAVIFVCTLVIAACTQYPERPIQPTLGQPDGFPEEFYRAARAKGQNVYVINPSERQNVLIRVFRGGSLASLGHDHVISGRMVHGYAEAHQDRSRIRADLYLPLDFLIVDDPHLRREAGFTTEISRDDVDATRRHMLEVLDFAQYPFIVIHAVCASSSPPCAMLDARITLHGVTRVIRIPIEFQLNDNRLLVSGHFSLLHSDFGMKPYSVLGSALRVKDKIEVNFKIEARRA